VGRGESAGGETCPCGGGRVWGDGVCWRLACPCGGGRVWGEESLLAVRPVHAAGGRARGEPPSGMLREEVCWR